MKTGIGIPETEVATIITGEPEIIMKMKTIGEGILMKEDMARKEIGIKVMIPAANTATVRDGMITTDAKMIYD